MNGLYGGFVNFCIYFVITKCHFMEVSVIQIGNSKGIRLSKTLIEKYNITDTVELILEEDCLILKAKSSPRAGWEEAFKKMHDAGDDQLLIEDVLGDENFEEWT
jgi:antitoxin MazE